MLIDIDRAVASKFVTFSHAENWMLYYTTAYGETFSIPIWRVFRKPMSRVHSAAEARGHMEAYNQWFSRQGGAQ